MGETLDSATAEHRATWPARALYRGATAIFVRGEWLDALVYRLLAHRYATRRHEGGQPDAVHFFVGSLGFGGAQRQLVILVRYLVDRGYRCKVWVQERQTFFETAIEDAGADWECVFDSPAPPRRGGLFFHLWRRLRARSHVWTALALAARLRRERPAVLQCFLDTTNVAGALAGRMAGVPVVVAGLRSLHPGERNAAMASRFQQHCYRLLRPSLVDALIANSNSGRVSFLRHQPEMPASKVRVVRSGLDPTPPSSATAEIRGRLNLPPEVPVVLWAGRLAPEKRLDVFLDACTTLSESGRRFVALVVGDGAERRRMEALAAQLGLAERVRFLGLRGDVLDIVQVARVAVLTSEIEGLANILLEAQLAACPTVATRAGGTPEVVEDEVTGFLVEIGDHAAVASNVARLLDDPALAAAMGRAGTERSRRLFGAARMGQETLEIYRELAEKRGFRIYAAGDPGDTALDAHLEEEPQGSLPMRALCRVVAAVFDRCGWLDALAYRLLALRYATRSHEVADGETIHFFVGSLGLGGAQRQLVTLVRHLVGRGYRCKVWVQERRTFFEAELEDAGATWQYVVEAPDLSSRGRLRFQLWSTLRYRSHVWPALALAARFRRERPAVLQCLLDIPTVAGALAGRMAGVPMVVAGLFNLHPGERRGDAATRFQRRCYRLLSPPLVDAVIANSESGRASFLLRQPEMPASKVRVVRSGLDPAPPSSATDAEIRRRLGLPPDLPLVLWAGRLAPEKRVDVLLRACADLAARGCPFVALIVGDGRERTAMEVLGADLGLSDRVRFVGLRRDVPDIIRVARVTVLTSEIEGFPSILLEAQLAGCPVVATRAGGTSEVVEDGVTGFLVEIGDHAAVASKIARLIDDPALASEMGRAGAERSRRLFGATRMGEETLAVYSELAKRQGFHLDAAGGRGGECG